MAVIYMCRHCRTPMGKLEGNLVTEERLGFHSLTPEERSDIIAYDSHGNVTVRICCDYCREAIEAHPELALLSSPLQ